MRQNTSHAVMAQRHEPADSFDLFPTPAWGTRALCEHFLSLGYPLYNCTVWEPACGLGHMARPLAEYFSEVYSSDAVDYGHGDVYDFLSPSEKSFHFIITNPPFRLAERFALAAIERASFAAAMLVRTAFLEGKARYENLFSKYPPSHVLQFVERLPMCKGRVDPDLSTATSYCWIVWSSPMGWRNRPTNFDWIRPCRKRLERPQDYIEVGA